MLGKKVFALVITAVFAAAAFVGISVAEPLSDEIEVNEDYARYVEETLVSYGSWEGYGFRAAGSSAENMAALFIEQEMIDVGLDEVRREKVPVDAWEFSGASLAVSNGHESHEFIASSMGGVPGTPPEGVSGEIVYVDRGSPQEFPESGVEGKLLLVDWDPNWFWVNLIGHQATIDGANGVIISTMNHHSYYEWPDSIGSFDATYDDDWVPLIVISRNDGFTLMDLMMEGPVMGTMISSIEITLAEDGGSGYNVVGVLPGTDHDHPIIILGHHDAWFFGASDDTSAIAGMLAWAKALKEADMVPKHDLIFVATTGEEYGYTDSYYEWLIGAWYMITQEHPDWAWKAIAFLNIEGLGGRWFDGITTGPFVARTNYQLAPLVRKVFSHSLDLLPNGYHINTQLSSWQDGWTLTAAGIPGITFSDWIPGYDAIYHTDKDNLSLIHYDDMAEQVKVMNRVLVALDDGELLPYTFTDRARNIAGSVDPEDYSYLGIDASELDWQISEFKSLARKYDRISHKLSSEDIATANELLTQASQLINREWTALCCWDSVIYPTQQLEWDATWLMAALEFLEEDDLKGALDELLSVGLTWNAFFDYEVWKWENDRHYPETDHLNWGAQGHLAPYVDIFAPYISLKEKYEIGGPYDFTWEIETLEEVLESEIEELENRVSLQTEQLMQVNAILTQLIELATT